jgi:hypothetical protein
MKSEPDALDIAKNESRGAKHEKLAQRLGTTGNESVAQNINKGLVALGTAKNESGSAKNGNWT